MALPGHTPRGHGPSTLPGPGAGVSDAARREPTWASERLPCLHMPGAQATAQPSLAAGAFGIKGTKSFASGILILSW